LTEIRKEADEHFVLFQRVISGALVQRDHALTRIVRQCLTASQELASLVESLRIRSGKSKHIEAAAKSLKALLKESEVKRLQERLDRIRDLLCSHLLVLIRYGCSLLC
jgi:hypothetical protein